MEFTCHNKKQHLPGGVVDDPAREVPEPLAETTWLRPEGRVVDNPARIVSEPLAEALWLRPAGGVMDGPACEVTEPLAETTWLRPAGRVVDNPAREVLEPLTETTWLHPDHQGIPSAPQIQPYRMTLWRVINVIINYKNYYIIKYMRSSQDDCNCK